MAASHKGLKSKLKMSLRLIEHHAMNVYGEVEVELLGNKW
jgi:hypothetical protein